MSLIHDSALKMQAWARGEPFAPWEVEVYPTNRCNLRCRFCLQRVERYDYAAELPVETWLDLIRDGAAMGVEAWVLLGGGEPFARREVTMPMIRTIKNYGMHGTVITNGTLFTSELIAEMVDLQWDSVLFSLETHDANTQDLLMDCPGAFAKITNTLKAFRDEKAKRKVRLPRLVLQPTITNVNYQHLWGLHRLSYELGVEFLCFKAFEAFTPDAKTLRLTDAQKNRVLLEAPEIKDWCGHVGLRTNIHQFRDQNAKCDYEAINRELIRLDSRLSGEFLQILCHMPWRKMTIKADGGVEPCVGVNRGGTIAGRSLRQIWLSPEFNQVREQLFHHRRLPECSLCGYGIPVTTFEKLKFINQQDHYPELSVFPLEIVAP